VRTGEFTGLGGRRSSPLGPLALHGVIIFTEAAAPARARPLALGGSDHAMARIAGGVPQLIAATP
jgi:hypothetical protein